MNRQFKERIRTVMVINDIGQCRMKMILGKSELFLQSQGTKTKKQNLGPTKAEIVTKFLDELQQSVGKKKYTLNDLVAKRRQKQEEEEEVFTRAT